MQPRVVRSTPASRPATQPRGRIRIIGGVWKRTPIPVADAPGLRPTPDRVRETAFNWIMHCHGGTLAGLSALDLFAGTGAMGFEAASRGAARVVLVEQDRAALYALAALKDKLVAANIEIRPADALATAHTLIRDQERFDIIFLDPPYRSEWMARLLPLAATLCYPTGSIYAEADSALEGAALAACGLEMLRKDKAGEVFYHLLRRKNDE